jgi:hypothetical protein
MVAAWCPCNLERPFRSCLERSRGHTLIIRGYVTSKIGRTNLCSSVNIRKSSMRPSNNGYYYGLDDVRETLLLLSGGWHTFPPECRRLSSGEIDQPQLQALDHGPGPIGDPQLRDDVLDVVLGRTEANYEIPSYLTVGASQLH